MDTSKFTYLKTSIVSCEFKKIHQWWNFHIISPLVILMHFDTTDVFDEDPHVQDGDDFLNCFTPWTTSLTCSIGSSLVCLYEQIAVERCRGFFFFQKWSVLGCLPYTSLLQLLFLTNSLWRNPEFKPSHKSASQLSKQY